MNCGIYAIKNKINGKVYIGSSKNLSDRRNRHFYFLRHNLHYNNHLQQSSNKYGLENFEWIILEYCSLERLLDKENFYISKYQALNKNFGYNISPDANRTVMSEKTKEKLRQINKNKILTAKTKNLIRLSKLGKKRPKEAVIKMRAAMVANYGKAVIQLTLEGTFIRGFDSLHAVAKLFGYQRKSIKQRIEGKYKDKEKPYKGFLWISAF